MRPEHKLVHLGARYERLRLAARPDFDGMGAVEREIEAIAQASPEMWPGMWVVRGQNFVREARGLGRLGV